MKARLMVTVSENALPALITVRSMGGRLILYKKIYQRRNFLCFCSCERDLIITVRPYNADFFEKSYFIKLWRCPPYYIRLDFAFTNNSERLQVFYLVDENYGIPVKQAELFFSGGG
ncbi:MAG: hypothetical protein IJU83_02765 [Clostridia bacterium]|nr:hypothetical protein [Clostridia bacterium]